MPSAEPPLAQHDRLLKQPGQIAEAIAGMLLSMGRSESMLSLRCMAEAQRALLPRAREVLGLPHDARRIVR